MKSTNSLQFDIEKQWVSFSNIFLTLFVNEAWYSLIVALFGSTVGHRVVNLSLSLLQKDSQNKVNLELEFLQVKQWLCFLSQKQYCYCRGEIKVLARTLNAD